MCECNAITIMQLNPESLFINKIELINVSKQQAAHQHLTYMGWAATHMTKTTGLPEISHPVIEFLAENLVQSAKA